MRYHIFFLFFSFLVIVFFAFVMLHCNIGHCHKSWDYEKRFNLILTTTTSIF